eukprot:TRINITY_DN3186_c0_g1_i1.p1 TRINITY_DN3186_c0_g1~~TRINITY_DN3186_c0_g1_i1.p1  ORF type:complete len:417 (-),score=21.29 TRINITY_DN3186_c0_g1_i1:130-1380(-)
MGKKMKSISSNLIVCLVALIIEASSNRPVEKMKRHKRHRHWPISARTSSQWMHKEGLIEEREHTASSMGCKVLKEYPHLMFGRKPMFGDSDVASYVNSGYFKNTYGEVMSNLNIGKFVCQTGSCGLAKMNGAVSVADVDSQCVEGSMMKSYPCYDAMKNAVMMFLKNQQIPELHYPYGFCNSVEKRLRWVAMVLYEWSAGESRAPMTYQTNDDKIVPMYLALSQLPTPPVGVVVYLQAQAPKISDPIEVKARGTSRKYVFLNSFARATLCAKLANKNINVVGMQSPGATSECDGICAKIKTQGARIRLLPSTSGARFVSQYTLPQYQGDQVFERFTECDEVIIPAGVWFEMKDDEGNKRVQLTELDVKSVPITYQGQPKTPGTTILSSGSPAGGPPRGGPRYPGGGPRYPGEAQTV